ncbi:rCG45611 [Rattus norvegicus]|uniref:RCG45611 n=1 Tax=Rattus norvegicus TaxID=10116 RepID=A6JU83_RAT|nr:rCG45611 [Rattus norvegicus]
MPRVLYHTMADPSLSLLPSHSPQQPPVLQQPWRKRKENLTFRDLWPEREGRVSSHKDPGEVEEEAAPPLCRVWLPPLSPSFFLWASGSGHRA